MRRLSVFVVLGLGLAVAAPLASAAEKVTVSRVGPNRYALKDGRIAITKECIATGVKEAELNDSRNVLTFFDDEDDDCEIASWATRG